MEAASKISRQNGDVFMNLQRPWCVLSGFCRIYRPPFAVGCLVIADR